MANKKLTELDAVTQVDGDAILYTVTDPSGSPASKKITHANLFGNVSSISPTTNNASAVANTRYFADVSGLTADRNFVLPAPGVAGEFIELSITTGDATYELVIIGDTGVTINGGSAATEWSRLFITGENIKLVATSTSNWQVVVDGRKRCTCRIYGDGPQSLTHNTTTTITLESEAFDVGDIGNTGSNQIVIRRANKYRILSGLQFNLVTSALTSARTITSILKGATVIGRMEAYGATTNVALQPSTEDDFAAGDAITMTGFQNSGSSVPLTYTVMKPYIVVTEVL